MEPLSPSVSRRLFALSQRFRDGLPERLREIEDLQDRLGKGATHSARELRLRVHCIAGSATTFGMERLSRIAAQAELSIEADLSARSGTLRPQTVDLLKEMKREVLNPGVNRAGDADIGNLPEPDMQRVVVIAGTIKDLPETFAEQLSVYGMLLFCVDEVSEVLEYFSDQGERVESCILLAEVSFLSENPRRLKEIQHLRTVHGEQIVTVLVGDEGDFKARLRSVRYGADAFIPTPVDVTALISQLDTILKQSRTEPYHILIVDDDPDQVSDTALALQRAGMITSVVTDPRNIFRILVEYKPELILMDMYMPECNGAELAAIIRQSENFVSIPIVFLSVETDTEQQLEAIKSGGDDFIVKPFNTEYLVTSIKIRAARTREMRFFMERDSLTGLLNHTNLKQRLEHEVQRARRIGTKLVFAMIDIDRFKNVNDTYGHLTGDRVIKSLSRLLVERLRRTDIVGRYGGEEFGVILFNTDAAQARRIMDEIRDSFGKIRHTGPAGEFTVTFSCGLAEFPVFETAPEVNEAADSALYRAKKAGRNRITVAAPDFQEDEDDW
jgi:diguanylate cyclase (GGDEF)-like protein